MVTFRTKLIVLGSLSEVVDVFSILPVSESGGPNGAGKGQGGDGRLGTPDTSTEGRKRSPISVKQYKSQDEEPSPQEMAYRSVRKAPVKGRSASPKDAGDWEAAKAVMG